MNSDTLQSTSNANKVNEEKQKLCDAVDKFAMKMKQRLYEKAAEGHRGWEDKQMIPVIRERLRRNYEHAILRMEELGEYNEKTYQDLIDTANLAMFLARFCEGDTQ